MIDEAAENYVSKIRVACTGRAGIKNK